jgi:hypothetical protein
MTLINILFRLLFFTGIIFPDQTGMIQDSDPGILPGPIDPQMVQDQDDMTWDDYTPLG